jgi:trans-aconitate 2-methyltransferase
LTVSWDPAQYERFGAERARPFHDLVAQIPSSDPDRVVDLGCGPGSVTATLADRWPRSHVYGLDSSPEMIEAAQRLARPGRLEFGLGDIAEWRPAPGSVDVIVSAASAEGVDRRGSVAHRVGPRSVSPVRPLDEYLDVLAREGLTVNAWETTYLHVLQGTDPVLEWFAGTGLRPYLDALAGEPDLLARFRAEVAERLRGEYAQRGYGTVLPFRRLFTVATRD